MSNFFSWSTTKTNKGFLATIKKNVSRDTKNEQGNYVDTEIVKTATFPTRTKASSYAKKYKRWANYQLNS